MHKKQQITKQIWEGVGSKKALTRAVCTGPRTPDSEQNLDMQRKGFLCVHALGEW